MKGTRRTLSPAGAPALLSVALFALLAAGCANTIATPANRYALVIGVQDYPADTLDLSYPDDDADSMATLLASTGWTVTKRLIATSDGGIATDGSPTKANIEAAIGDFAAYVGGDTASTILVYFSGHGSTSTDNSTAYLIPYDGLFNTETKTTGGLWIASYDLATQANWITPAQMTTWMGNIVSKNRILILDSCYSGGFVDTGSAVDASPQDSNTITGTSEDGLLFSAIANLNTLLAASVSREGDPDVITVSACGSEEESYDDSAHKHGTFTYYLLASADSGDTNQDGFVTTTEAFYYAKESVKAYWNSTHSIYGAALLPHISGGAGDLVLFANR